MACHLSQGDHHQDNQFTYPYQLFLGISPRRLERLPAPRPEPFLSADKIRHKSGPSSPPTSTPTHQTCILAGILAGRLSEHAKGALPPVPSDCQLTECRGAGDTGQSEAPARGTDKQGTPQLSPPGRELPSCSA
jgi:hypothetical protein